MGTLLPPAVLPAVPAATQSLILGKTFFPQLIAGPFQQSWRIAFDISAGLSLLAAVASLLRGQRVIHGETAEAEPERETVVEAGPMAE